VLSTLITMWIALLSCDILQDLEVNGSAKPFLKPGFFVVATTNTAILKHRMRADIQLPMSTPMRQP
jgi:hypothetical protein